MLYTARWARVSGGLPQTSGPRGAISVPVPVCERCIARDKSDSINGRGFLSSRKSGGAVVEIENGAIGIASHTAAW